MLSATFPYPPTRGGTQVRTFNLLKYLSHRHAITLVTQRAADVTDEEIAELRQQVHELVVFSRPDAAAQQGGVLGKAQRFGSFLSRGTPPSVMYLYSTEIQDWIDRTVESGNCDVITCEHSVNEIYVRSQYQDKVGTVVNIHSSVYGSCRNQLETGISENSLRDKINLPLLRRYEQRYSAKFSHLVVTTEDDERQLRAFNPDRPIHVIPNGVDLEAFPYRQQDPGGRRLVFVGAMDNLANIDAVRFLSLEILPAVQQRYPGTTLVLVGARPTPEVLALGSRPGVTVTGKVPSMARYLHQATVCVIPMRTGFGIKNKTLEAMAAGAPVVASDRGLEGLAVDGEGFSLRALRANQVEEYVAAIGRLFEDASLRQQLSRNGRRLIESEYTWARMGQRYEQALLQAQVSKSVRPRV